MDGRLMEEVMETEMTGSLSSVEMTLIAGVTYRQLDYWVRTGAIVPGVDEARGSGSQRRWSLGDVPKVRVMGAVMGVSPTADMAGEAARLAEEHGLTHGFLIVGPLEVEYAEHPVDALNTLARMGGAAMMLDLASLTV